ncbi:hypothetical protein T492DRAFT_967779 [Pavlovales sp. CCMP2436]|nr:hypothetical protein T492DRAFT_967779 [Pavlovales sp. CCMP2436]
MLGAAACACVERQELFFMATAPAPSTSTSALIELQPKAGTQLVLVDSSTVAFADASASGGRAAAQLRETEAGSGLLTLFLVAYELGAPSFLRLSGRGYAVSASEIEPDLLSSLPADKDPAGAGSRWVFVLHVEEAQFEPDLALSKALLNAPSANSELGSPQLGYLYDAEELGLDDDELLELNLEQWRIGSRLRLGSIPEHAVHETSETLSPSHSPAAARHSNVGGALRQRPMARGPLLQRQAGGGSPWSSLALETSTPQRWEQRRASAVELPALKLRARVRGRLLAWGNGLMPVELPAPGPVASALLGVGAVVLLCEGHLLIGLAARALAGLSAALKMRRC